MLAFCWCVFVVCVYGVYDTPPRGKGQRPPNFLCGFLGSIGSSLSLYYYYFLTLAHPLGLLGLGSLRILGGGGGGGGRREGV